MRCMCRNQSAVYYCLYKAREPILDSSGWETSEYRLVYDNAVLLHCNVSPAKGTAQVEQFGNLDSYDKVLVTDQVDCPIDESTVLFVDKVPVYKDGNPLYDYTVKRVARSKNSLAVALSKVTIS